jgi:hypothetical protein
MLIRSRDGLPPVRRCGRRFNWASREIVLRGTARRHASHHLHSGDRRRVRCRVQKECSRDYPETSNSRVRPVARRGLCRAGREHPLPDGCFGRQDQRHCAGAVRVDGGAVCRRRQSSACRAACRLLAHSLGRFAAPNAADSRGPVTACRAAPPRRAPTTGSAAGSAKASRDRSARDPGDLPARRQHPPC